MEKALSAVVWNFNPAPSNQPPSSSSPPPQYGLQLGEVVSDDIGWHHCRQDAFTSLPNLVHRQPLIEIRCLLVFQLLTMPKINAAEGWSPLPRQLLSITILCERNRKTRHDMTWLVQPFARVQTQSCGTLSSQTLPTTRKTAGVPKGAWFRLSLAACRALWVSVSNSSRCRSSAAAACSGSLEDFNLG